MSIANLIRQGAEPLGPGLTEVCSGLEFPEGGPIWLEDGSVILVEIRNSQLTRVMPNGEKQVIASGKTGLANGPNSSAVGPDGMVYCTLNGGFSRQEQADYKSGSIQKVNPATGEVTTLYTSGKGSNPKEMAEVRLSAPNDLVFDTSGGFYFTDNGKEIDRMRQATGVFYAKIDGSMCQEVIPPMDQPNGVGLSPDGKTLYVAETPTGRLWSFKITAPGVLEQNAAPLRGAVTKLVYAAPEAYQFDSLAVDSEGNICVATIGKGAMGTGGISVIKPDGSGLLQFIATGDPLTTNISFGGPDMKDAFITLSSSGKLVHMKWHCAGLKCNYEANLKPSSIKVGAKL